MPSAKILSEKQAYVADLKAKFESAVSGCVVAYGGINVENDTKLSFIQPFRYLCYGVDNVCPSLAVLPAVLLRKGGTV